MTTPSDADRSAVSSDLGPGAGVHLHVSGPLAQVTITGSAQRLGGDAFAGALRDIGSCLPGTVRVVVIRSEGPRFGPEFAGSRVGGAAAPPTVGTEFDWLSRPDLLTVAAIQGDVDGGYELVLACDLRVAAVTARFCLPHVRAGLVPTRGVTHRLIALVGYARALELCVTGRIVDADEALRINLVNRVVDPDGLIAATSDLVEALLGAPRSGAIEVKALLLSALGTRHGPQGEQAAQAAQGRLRRERAGFADG